MNSATPFTAGNSFGPYVFAEQTTNHPTPQFLASLRSTTFDELDVPNHLSANGSHAPPLASDDTTVDAFRYYLCASLARHHAYRKAHLDDTIPTLHYLSIYEIFQTRFTQALRSTLQDGALPTKWEQATLVVLECHYTGVSFALWPNLFRRSLEVNSALIHMVRDRAPTLLQVLRSYPHPHAFLTALTTTVAHNWIDLTDAKDMFRESDFKRQTWELQQRMKREMQERFGEWERTMRQAAAEYDAANDAINARNANRQAHVEHLRDRGVNMAGEAVRIWDDTLDGPGLAGWRRVLADRFLAVEEAGRRPREREMSVIPRTTPRGRVRERAPGIENVDPSTVQGGEGVEGGAEARQPEASSIPDIGFVGWGRGRWVSLR